MGDSVSAADLACAAYLLYDDVPDVDFSAAPRIRDWLNRIRALPGWIAPLRAMA